MWRWLTLHSSQSSDTYIEDWKREHSWLQNRIQNKPLQLKTDCNGWKWRTIPCILAMTHCHTHTATHPPFNSQIMPESTHFYCRYHISLLCPGNEKVFWSNSSETALGNCDYAHRRVSLLWGERSFVHELLLLAIHMTVQSSSCRSREDRPRKECDNWLLWTNHKYSLSVTSLFTYHSDRLTSLWRKANFL